jgi:peptide/nickel transport system permease protein
MLESEQAAMTGLVDDVVIRRRESLLRRISKAIRRDWFAIAALSFLTLLVLVAVFADSIAPYGGSEIIRDGGGKVLVLAPPSAQHWFGTTAYGRDVFSQMVFGTRPVLLVGLAASFIPTAFGYALGLMAGYIRGGVDTIISRTVEVWYAIPSEPFAIVLIVILEPSLLTLILAISLTYWRRPTRVVRNQVLTLSESGFIKSARVAGAGTKWIIMRHLVPLSLPLALVYIPIGFANAVLAEASLSFLGFGDPTLVSWGGIMRDAFIGGALTKGWWWIVIPGVAITLTALAIFLVSRPIEEVVDPRLASQEAVE